MKLGLVTITTSAGPEPGIRHGSAAAQWAARQPGSRTADDRAGMRCGGETVGPLPPSTVDPGGDAPQKKATGKARRATRRR